MFGFLALNKVIFKNIYIKSIIPIRKICILMFILFLSATACNRKDLWENNYTIPDVTITSASANNIPSWSITFDWIYPPITDMSGLHITCTNTSASTVVHTGSVGQSVTSYTINSGLVASQRYNINMRITDKWGKSSQGINFAITTQAGNNYFIYTESQLANVTSDLAGTYNLMADLDLSTGYNPWTPLGPFTGTFEGNEHAIRNLTITSGSQIGLFGNNSGNIRNIILNTATVTGSGNVGTIAGYNSGTISGCSATSINITGTGSNVGGITGSNISGSITGCSSSGIVTGFYNVGGIAGQSDGTIALPAYITGCSYSGTVTVTNFITAECIGGLVGENFDYSYIENSSVSGNVTGGNYTGGLVGRNHEQILTSHRLSGAVEGRLSTGGLIGENQGAKITGCSSAGNVTGSNTYTGGLIGYNTGGEIDNCHSSAGTVTGIADYIGGLIGSSTGKVSNCYSTCTVTVNAAADFIGGLIGNSTNAPISNSHSDGNISSNYVCTHVGGFIGRNTSTAMKIDNNCYSSGNLILNSTHYDYIGGFAGSNTGPINNCSSTSYVDITATAFTTNEKINAGGFIGVNDTANAVITGCHATGYIDADFYTDAGATAVVAQIGGFIGFNPSTAIIKSSYSTGNVDVVIYNTNGTTREVYAGGFVGRNDGGGFENCSYSIGTVDASGGTATSTFIGGLIGENVDASLFHCNSKGDVKGKNNVGGLIGSNSISSGEIKECYATGNVSGTEYVGGLVGYNSGCPINNSYAKGNVTGTNSTTGGLTGSIVNLTQISNCYAIGVVSPSTGGGLIGALTGSTFDTSFFNEVNTGNPLGIPESLSYLRIEGTYTAEGWTTFGSVWQIDTTGPPYDNDGYPYLLGNLP